MEDRRALLVESGEAFVVVLGIAELSLSDVLGIDAGPQTGAVIADVLDQGAAGEESLGGAVGCALGDAPGKLQQLLRRYRAGEEPRVHRLRAGDEVTSDDEVHRAVRS